MNVNIILDKRAGNNKGSGLGVIFYGITLLLILLFTAINIVNSKVIENGYNSLRDAVYTASSGSVIHLLTTNRSEKEGATRAQAQIIEQSQYDVYLQLALGYLINRKPDITSLNNDTYVQSGEINNFIKLDHQKVVNTTLALLEDAVIRKKDRGSINDTENYKIMMFFIEPYQNESGQKYFDIIAYGNGDYKSGTITKELARYPVSSTNKGNMKEVYFAVEDAINSIVNCDYDGMTDKDAYKYGENVDKKWEKIKINLNSRGTSNYDELIREMETYPHYVIVVKDFALPTIFDGDTNDFGSGIKSVFTELSGDGTLSSPMCALNTGKVQRQVEDAGWSKKR